MSQIFQSQKTTSQNLAGCKTRLSEHDDGKEERNKLESFKHKWEFKPTYFKKHQRNSDRLQTRHSTDASPERLSHLEPTSTDRKRASEKG